MDPRGRGASISFQKIDAPDPQVNWIHFDIWVPPDQAQVRIAAAIAAGGRLVTDKYAPAWWTLADPEGNLADVATTMSRDLGVSQTDRQEGLNLVGLQRACRASSCFRSPLRTDGAENARPQE